jgi:hypothetical protein
MDKELARLESGTLRLQPLKGPYDTGMVVVYIHDSVMHVATIQHLDKDQRYYIMGTYDGYTEPDPVFYKFIIQAELRDYTLKFNDWYKVIKAKVPIDRERDWYITPLKFKEGKSPKTCSRCYSHFIGSPSQPNCKGCCEELAFGSLTNSFEETKKKRPRLISPVVMDIIIKEAYLAGTKEIPFSEMMKELKTKLENGYYRT